MRSHWSVILSGARLLRDEAVPLPLVPGNQISYGTSHNTHYNTCIGLVCHRHDIFMANKSCFLLVYEDNKKQKHNGSFSAKCKFCCWFNWLFFQLLATSNCTLKLIIGDLKISNCVKDWMDGEMNGWMDRQMDKWMDRMFSPSSTYESYNNIIYNLKRFLPECRGKKRKTVKAIVLW